MVVVLSTRAIPHYSLHASGGGVPCSSKVVVSLASVVLRMLVVQVNFALGMEVFEQILLLSLAVAHIERVSGVLFMVVEVV